MLPPLWTHKYVNSWVIETAEVLNLQEESKEEDKQVVLYLVVGNDTLIVFDWQA